MEPEVPRSPSESARQVQPSVLAASPRVPVAPETEVKYPTAPPPPEPRTVEPSRRYGSRRTIVIGGITLALLLTLGLVTWGTGSLTKKEVNNNAPLTAEQTVSDFNTTNLNLGSLPFITALQGGGMAGQTLSVNGQVQVSDGLVLTPTGTAPSNPKTGELYYDQATNQPYYYDGTGFVSVKPVVLRASAYVGSIGSLTGNVALGSGLKVSGGKLDTALQPTVSSLTGTDGQVLVSASTGGVVLSLPQSIAKTSSPEFAGLSLAGNLTADAATVAGNLKAGSLTLGSARTFTFQSGSSATDLTFTLPAADGSTGQCLSTDGTGTLGFKSCVSSVGTNVSSLDGLTGDLSIADASTSGSTITIDNASTSAKGIAQFNATNFTAVSGLINTVQDIAVTSSPTFASLTLTSPLTVASGGTGATVANGARSNLGAAASGANNDITALSGLTTALSVGQGGTEATTASGARFNIGAAASGSNSDITATNVLNTITPTNTLTVGAVTQSFVLQGNNSSTVIASNGVSATALGFVNPIANTTLNFPALAAGTYSLCTTSGNCSGSGGGVTTPGGTTNKLPKFTAAQTLGDSLVSDNGSTVTIAGAGVIQGAGGVTLGVGSSTAGKIVLQNSANNNTLTLQSGSTGSNLAFTLPTADGSNGQCLSSNGSGVLAFQNCLTGSGSGGGVSSMNGLSGSVTLANASGAGSTVTINDASTTQKGIAQFNATNFSASGGVINTAQDITTAASPMFTNLSLTGTTGLTVGTSSVQGKLTVRDGNASLFAATIQAVPLTASRTVTLPDESGTVCYQSSTNCGFTASSGSGNYIQNQNSSQQTTANYWISGTGRADTSLLTPLLDTATATTLNLGTTNATAINLNRATTISAGSAPGSGLTVTTSSAGPWAISIKRSDASSSTINFFDSSGTLQVYDNGGTNDNLQLSQSGNLTVRTSVLTPLLDTASATALNIGTTTATAINLNQNTAVASNKSFTANGTATFADATNSTTAFQIQNASATSVLTVDTTNSQLQIRNLNDAAVPGSELFTSSYSFPATTGWTSISGTGQSATATHTNGGGTTALSPTPAMTVSSGQLYQLVFTVSGMTTATMTPALGGATGTAISANGTYTQYFQTTSTANLSFTPDNTFDGTVTAVSFKLMGNSTPVLVINDSTGAAAVQVRTGKSSNGSLAIGYNTLLKNVGSNNTALGDTALRANTTGYENTAVGGVALIINTTGYRNTAVGLDALAANTSGYTNAALGYGALYSNTSGYSNTAVGLVSLRNNTTGSYNVGLGEFALGSNTTGNFNTGAGLFAGYQSSQSDFQTPNNISNATLIGSYSQATCSNCLILGGQGADALTGGVGIGTPNPTNFLSVQPKQYNTGTVATTSGSGAVVGTGTTFTSAMVGSEIYIASNSNSTATYKGTISAFTDATDITVSPTVGFTISGAHFYILYSGLQVNSTGQVGIGTLSPAYSLDVQGTVNASTSLFTSLIDTATATALHIGTNNATSINLDKSTNLATSRSLTYGSGNGNFDQSASSGSFATGTGTVSLNGTTTVASNKSFIADGSALFADATNSTTAFQVQNASATPVLTVDTTDSQLQIRNLNDAAVAGSEMFTSSYSFPATTGWTGISGNGSSATATHTNGGGGTALSPTPAMGVSSGTVYKVTYTVSSMTTGSVTASIGGVSGTTVSSNTTQTDYITTTSTGNLTFTPTNTFDGTVTSVSVMQMSSQTPSLLVKDSTGATAAVLRVSTVGIGNLALGGNALPIASGVSSTVGGLNTAIGTGALQDNTSGYENTALGNSTLQYNTTGGANVAVGYDGVRFIFLHTPLLELQGWREGV